MFWLSEVFAVSDRERLTQRVSLIRVDDWSKIWGEAPYLYITLHDTNQVHPRRCGEMTGQNGISAVGPPDVAGEHDHPLSQSIFSKSETPNE